MSLSTCVIYNPAAGRGKALRELEDARKRFGGDIELRPTSAAGHAVELARQAAQEGFSRVVAAGGDGTVHEVANGLLTSGRDDVLLSTWPVGSSCDYAYSLGMLRWWRERSTDIPLDTMRVDVGLVRAGGRERYCVNSFGVGFNGMVTVEAHKIRWLRGLPLYALAFLRAMVEHFQTPPMTVRFDDAEGESPTLAVSVNLAQREGGFPITSAARLDDGRFDYLHAAAMRRWELLRYLPAMIAGNLPTNHPQLRTGRCTRAAVRAGVPLCVHADGEFVCRPEDGIREVEIELLPGRLLVEVCRPFLYGA
ncbi:diacylglycerol/lipid kinase family protein [Fimbriiglobus ruber]|uniref:diacylglycerol/lipid kinase family protein n=1 Tax=Fimbriiglobus ruber TaxID=1908690 RepID=UPI00137AEB57|nr:diacylglycerol kinase family protein [Fimbriiglobus ruber]